jgi:hypothetical protein
VAVLSEVWESFLRWVDTWQWGNVPSWFSALSFAAAALAFWRDRSIRLRRQVDDVGAWGESNSIRDSLGAGTGHYSIATIITVENATNKNVNVVAIKYSASYRWQRKANLTYYPLKSKTLTNWTSGSRVKPDLEQMFSAKVLLFGKEQEQEGTELDGTIGTTVRAVYLSDSSGLRWVTFPSRRRAPRQVGFFRLYGLAIRYPLGGLEWSTRGSTFVANQVSRVRGWRFRLQVRALNRKRKRELDQ